MEVTSGKWKPNENRELVSGLVARHREGREIRVRLNRRWRWRTRRQGRRGRRETRCQTRSLGYEMAEGSLRSRPMSRRKEKMENGRFFVS
jgi:hypothetical protein